MLSAPVKRMQRNTLLVDWFRYHSSLNVPGESFTKPGSALDRRYRRPRFRPSLIFRFPAFVDRLDYLIYKVAPNLLQNAIVIYRDFRIFHFMEIIFSFITNIFLSRFGKSELSYRKIR